MEKYVCIENADGKVWILPEKNIKIALCLYQPSAKKGLILKKYLPVVNTFSFVFKPFYGLVGIKRIWYSIDYKLLEYLESVFGSDIQCAFFMGTPSTHQKITIQVSRENQILGYCKITNNPEIGKLFQHEKEMLDFLENAGIENIPRCLSCDFLKDGRYTFAQTTKKTLKSTTFHFFHEPEYLFLEQLKNKTRSKCSYTHTDFYESVNSLKISRNVLEKNGYCSKSILKAIEELNEYYKNVDFFGVCHRDFTPWNMFYENNKLFVFDFEYARYRYPEYLDAIHYFMQTSIFEKKLNEEEILKAFFYEISEGFMQGLFANPRIALLSYLLDIISLYVKREKTEFSGDVKKNMSIWMCLCTRLVN